MNVRELCQIGLLAALLTVFGAVRLPSFFPGAEFQLSAPLAVAVCAAMGFRKYIIAGLLSSALGLLLGTQTLLHVSIALLFRLCVGGVLYVGENTRWAIVLSGPVASAAARLSLSVLLGKAVYPLLFAAIPGMVLTALAAYPMTRILQRLQRAEKGKRKYVVQR